jgi:hypothetical protein
MREILSPLSGIRSPFGQLTSPLAFYAVQQRDGGYILDRAGNYIEVRA